MNYTTYWSILDAPSQTTKSNIVCLAVAFGFGILWFLIKKFKKETGEGDKAILLWGAGTFAVIALVMFFVLTFVYKDNSQVQMLKMLDSPNTPKVEGVVSNFESRFRSTKGGGVTTESFTVDSIQFAYSDAPLSKFNSFSNTNNPVIFNGQKVRITYKIGSPYYGQGFNEILRIEIGR